MKQVQSVMMNCPTHYLIIILFAILFSNELSQAGFMGKNNKSRKGIRIDRIESCGHSKNPSYRWDEVRIQNSDNGLTSVYSKGEALRDIAKLFITLDVQRCATKENLDSCQQFAKLNPLDTCQLIVMKKMAWSGFVESFEPEIGCPVKKGIYVSKNATLDPNLAFFFPIDNWYWRIKAKVSDERHEHIMVCLDFQSYKINIQ